MLLTRKSSPAAGPASSSSLVSSLARGVRRAIPTMDRRAFLRRSGSRRRRRPGHVAAHAGAQGARSRRARRIGQDGRRAAHRLHALLGRLRRRRRRRERRLGAAGAGVRFADQPGRALRQGRRAARARPRRVPPEDADEAGRRQVRAHQLGPGAGRDQRQDARAEEAERPRFGVRGRLVEAQQRAVVPAQEVGQLLGQQQHRPPGPHLPLHHCRGRREHVGLRRDDELVQRHAQLEVRPLHRLERRRGSPGVDAAHAACQGDRLQDDRGRPALHPHGGQGRRVHPPALGLRHPVPVRDAAPHLQERLGGHEVHRRPRLRHGPGQGRGAGQVDPRQGAGGLRGRRGDRLQGRQDDGGEPAEHASSGAWARPSTPPATPSSAPPASCSSRSATSA